MRSRIDRDFYRPWTTNPDEQIVLSPEDLQSIASVAGTSAVRGALEAVGLGLGYNDGNSVTTSGQTDAWNQLQRFTEGVPEATPQHLVIAIGAGAELRRLQDTWGTETLQELMLSGAEATPVSSEK